jgi:outer membrane protein assembly factor BamB
LAPGNASPVVYDGKVYALSKAGVLSCGDIKTGQMLWQQRLKGTFWATPVIADGHCYCVNQDGTCIVVKLGEKAQIVHEGALGEPIYATPAAAGNGLYLRSEKHLWKIAAPE